MHFSVIESESKGLKWHINDRYLYVEGVYFLSGECKKICLIDTNFKYFIDTYF